MERGPTHGPLRSNKIDFCEVEFACSTLQVVEGLLRITMPDSTTRKARAIQAKEKTMNSRPGEIWAIVPWNAGIDEGREK
jgi:hypothetical protein